MQLKLSDISPGDIIEHESWGCNHGGVQERLTRRKGKVIQVTDNVITLQGKNYPAPSQSLLLSPRTIRPQPLDRFLF